MTDLVMTVVFIVIALAIVVRTVFYGIQVVIEAKMNKRSLKMLNKLMKSYKPVMDYLDRCMDELVDD